MDRLYLTIENAFKSKNIVLDSGLTHLFNGIKTAQEEHSAEVLALDLIAAFNRRKQNIIGAEIALEIWSCSGSIAALNIVKDFMQKNKWRLKGDLSEYTKSFADAVKNSLSPPAEAALEKRTLSVKEIQLLFSLIERLSACTSLEDKSLLKALVERMKTDASDPYYNLMGEYIDIYGELNDEAVPKLCNLCRDLSEKSPQILHLNPDVSPIVNYLITVSCARTYIAAKRARSDVDLNRCGYCANSLDDETDEHLYDSNYYEPSIVECRFCKYQPLEEHRKSFIASVQRDLNSYCFLPSARLFWDLHEYCDFSYHDRRDITDRTNSCKRTYDMVHPPQLYLDSTFFEKT